VGDDCRERGVAHELCQEDDHYGGDGPPTWN
jgi:hypothetical protein